MPKAIKVTEENIDYIVAYARLSQFDLSYVSDNAEDAATYGESIYVINDGKADLNNIVFTTFWSTDFFRIWKFAIETEDTTQFMETVKI